MACIVSLALAICRTFQQQEGSTLEDGHVGSHEFPPASRVTSEREVFGERGRGSYAVYLGYRGRASGSTEASYVFQPNH